MCTLCLWWYNLLFVQCAPSWQQVGPIIIISCPTMILRRRTGWSALHFRIPKPSLQLRCPETTQAKRSHQTRSDLRFPPCDSPPQHPTSWDHRTARPHSNTIKYRRVQTRVPTWTWQPIKFWQGINVLYLEPGQGSRSSWSSQMWVSTPRAMVYAVETRRLSDTRRYPADSAPSYLGTG